MAQVEIDFEVFKEITARRASEDITPNDVLRDLFGLPKKQIHKTNLASNAKAWISKGITFPHGTEFRAIFKGKTYFAKVEEGALLIDGKRFSSPSAAATSITGTAVNGWIFWECKFPGENKWKLIKNLR